MSTATSPGPLVNGSLSVPVGQIDLSLFSSKDVYNSKKIIQAKLPYIVFVLNIVEPFYRYTEYFQAPCTGTLVRNDLVLTTASCLIANSHDIPNPATITVYERTGTKLEALKIYIHPQYIYDEGFDFAVIVVQKSPQKYFPKLERSETQDFKKIIHSCALGGHGSIDTIFKNGLPPFRMILLNVTEVNVLRCRETTPELTHLCLHFPNLTPCPGDVGSPLICDDEVYAIYTPRLSSDMKGAKCIDRYNTLFTTLSPVHVWVKRIVTAQSDPLMWMNNPFYILLLCGAVLAVIGGIYYCVVECLQKTFSTLVDEEEPEQRAATNGSSSDIRTNRERVQWGV